MKNTILEKSKGDLKTLQGFMLRYMQPFFAKYIYIYMYILKYILLHIE